MTEAEALEIIGLYTANAHTLFTIFVTFTFAYFATAHFVGAALTSFQTIAASGLYVISASCSVLALVANIQVWQAVDKKTRTVMDELPLFDATFWITFLSLVMVLGIAISLYFMWDVRRRRAE